MQQQTMHKVLSRTAPWQDADDSLSLIREGETMCSFEPAGTTRKRLLLILGSMAPAGEVMLASPAYLG